MVNDARLDIDLRRSNLSIDDFNEPTNWTFEFDTELYSTFCNDCALLAAKVRSTAKVIEHDRVADLEVVSGAKLSQGRTALKSSLSNPLDVVVVDPETDLSDC